MRIPRDRRVCSFSPDHPPAVTVDAGTELVLEANDCFDGQKKGKPLDWADYEPARVNPATGPVYVRGAEPGDVLVAEIVRVDVGPVGFVSAVPRGAGPREWKEVRIEGGLAAFTESIRIPVQPVIGVIGVAPAQGSIGNSVPGDHGGNLDTADIKTGAKVHLPVAVPGALFGLGDVHALQGDGEVCGQGIEIEADVTVRLDVLSQEDRPAGTTGLRRPMVETADHFAFCASAKTLDEAIPLALDDARDFLMAGLGVSDAEAAMLVSLVGDVRISQIVNPLKTVRVCVPRKMGTEPFFAESPLRPLTAP
jgi:amidase